MKRIGMMLIAVLVVSFMALGTTGSVFAEEMTVEGTVQSAGDGFALETDSGSFMIDSDDDFSDYVGKTVKMTGSVTSEEGTQYIVPSSYELVQAE